MFCICARCESLKMHVQKRARSYKLLKIKKYNNNKISKVLIAFRPNQGKTPALQTNYIPGFSLSATEAIGKTRF